MTECGCKSELEIGSKAPPLASVRRDTAFCIALQGIVTRPEARALLTMPTGSLGGSTRQMLDSGAKRYCGLWSVFHLTLEQMQATVLRQRAIVLPPLAARCLCSPRGRRAPPLWTATACLWEEWNSVRVPKPRVDERRIDNLHLAAIEHSACRVPNFCRRTSACSLERGRREHRTRKVCTDWLAQPGSGRSTRSRVKWWSSYELAGAPACCRARTGRVETDVDDWAEPREASPAPRVIGPSPHFAPLEPSCSSLDILELDRQLTCSIARLLLGVKTVELASQLELVPHSCGRGSGKLTRTQRLGHTPRQIKSSELECGSIASMKAPRIHAGAGLVLTHHA